MVVVVGVAGRVLGASEMSAGECSHGYWAPICMQQVSAPMQTKRNQIEGAKSCQQKATQKQSENPNSIALASELAVSDRSATRRTTKFVCV